MTEPRVDFRRFHHLTVAVADLPAAVAAWADVLGWAPESSDPTGAAYPLDGTVVRLVPAQPDGRTGVVEVGVEVDDVAGTAARIRAAGGGAAVNDDGTAAVDPASVNGVPMVLVPLDDEQPPVHGAGPFTRVNHLVVAVRDDEEAMTRWAAMFGQWEPFAWEHEVAHHVPVGIAWFGLTSAGTDAGALGSFLARRGEGIYAVGLVAEDQPATLAALAARGARVIDGGPSGQVFLHPSTTHGLLVDVQPERPPGQR
jgi:catechol 2,3-dioxygenase-like lactoylglutathione lyase family enzyme